VRVAALYDVHGNLPALDAVLAEAEQEGIERVVSGGDLLSPPFAAECLERMVALGDRVVFVRGNADRQASGFEEVAARWPLTSELDVGGLGRVLFCHGSPRSDEEMLLRTASDERLTETLAGVEADIVVCGHTHMQFEREVGGKRVVNAGSVGLPYGATGAHWVELGPDIRHRRTTYDLTPLRASEWPRAAEIISVIEAPPTEEEAIAEFEQLIAAGRDATLIQ
jgi:putative phosphoesterase